MTNNVLKKDKSIIPKGLYCYDNNGVCPYWSLNAYHEPQNNGYCAFMGKGDWDLNKEKSWRVTYKDGKSIPNAEWQSGEDIGLSLSLLWDQCKECGINEEENYG